LLNLLNAESGNIKASVSQRRLFNAVGESAFAEISKTQEGGYIKYRIKEFSPSLLNNTDYTL